MSHLPAATQTYIFVGVAALRPRSNLLNIDKKRGWGVDSAFDVGLLGDSGVELQGSDLSLDEALALAKKIYKWMPLCAVEEWVIMDAIVTEDERAKVAAAGCQPMFMFAHKVVDDEQQRFEPGHWVRSSMGTAFTDGFLFVTRNSVYVLLGPGHRKSASIQAIFSIF
ncbi:MULTISPECIES: DUF6957 family protein [Pseudomonas]|jgi:hypothetical protein|uniref:DUF6957 family protein n=1 Tax=Pseudomonas TaxID=286 RepID=UPI000A51A378|nr:MULTISPECIES: hypothetical protein [Pseudomonas]MBB4059128.1 hypothetical protein [Pseudomonas koreensis]